MGPLRIYHGFQFTVFYEIPGAEQAGLVFSLALFLMFVLLIFYYLKIEFGHCITQLAYFEMLATREVLVFYP